MSPPASAVVRQTHHHSHRKTNLRHRCHHRGMVSRRASHILPCQTTPSRRTAACDNYGVTEGGWIMPVVTVCCTASRCKCLVGGVMSELSRLYLTSQTVICEIFFKTLRRGPFRKSLPVTDLKFALFSSTDRLLNLRSQLRSTATNSQNPS